MISTKLTAQAAALAQRAHAGQLDKAGEPYIDHPFAVAEQMDTEEEVCVALLHDVVEDSDLSFGDLRDAGMPESVVAAVELLTKEPGQEYFSYIFALRADPLAAKVKRADLMHNLDMSRLKRQTSFDMRRRAKYIEALAIIDGDVEACLLEENKRALRAAGVGRAKAPAAPALRL